MGKLTQQEANLLIEMLKKAAEQKQIEFPPVGEKLEFEVVSTEPDEKFTVNIYRKRIDPKGATYQGRVSRSGEALMRLDVTQNGRHRNPDGEMIVGTHLHVYTEEHGMLMAISFDTNKKDLFELCLAFFEKFNIIEPPVFQEYQQSLFDIGESV
jgi:hypothetical protein